MDLQSMRLAHDLKMPIQLIYSCVQLLEMELSPNARAEGYLQMLIKSADQLNSMVHGVLDAPNEEELHPEIRDVVNDARMICRQMMLCAGEKGARVHFETNVARFMMPMDRQKLERILTNLLSNALRFTLSAGHVSLSVWARGDAVEFVVADDGRGIPDEKQQAIFENGVSEGGHGYGLGIVRDYARMLGGDVRLESALGRGSRFTVRLPVRRTSITPASEKRMVH